MWHPCDRQGIKGSHSPAIAHGAFRCDAAPCTLYEPLVLRRQWKDAQKRRPAGTGGRRNLETTQSHARRAHQPRRNSKQENLPRPDLPLAKVDLVKVPFRGDLLVMLDIVLFLRDHARVCHGPVSIFGLR